MRVSPRQSATLLACALTAGCAVAAHALPAGTAEPARVADIYANGVFSQSNSRDGSAILTAGAMPPGGSATGTVAIANDGDLAGDIALSTSHLTDTPGPLGGRLSERLDLVVSDVTQPAAPATVYAGRLDGLGTVTLGRFAPGEAHTYRFTVRFLDGGSPSADNAYRQSSASVQFDWTATGDGGGTTDPPPGGSPPAEPPAPQPSDPSPQPSEPAPQPSEPVTSTPSGDTPAPSPPPTSPPTPAPGPLRLSLGGPLTQRPLRAKSVAVNVTCSAACAVTASGSAGGIKLGAASAQVAAGKSATLKLKLSGGSLSAMRKALSRRAKVAVVVTVTARAGGVTSTAKRTISLKR